MNLIKSKKTRQAMLPINNNMDLIGFREEYRNLEALESLLKRISKLVKFPMI